MIEITPIAIDDKNNLISLVAYENGKEIGYISFVQLKENLKLTGFTYDYIDVGELLIRAAASYAERRAIPKIIADNISNPLLKQIGFTEENGMQTLDVSKIIHYK